ncbi:MAG: NADH-quinone oxidoreductase subunit NuoF [Synergistaceae bacterium]|jgi:NADH-quinone oxidoreductase subunit F/NADP-reducing hydrogenase subunit HndC|nr:NADH-quinone oxidoreductase subunit NuoF [Synergistaceae bacterium]PKL04147.1 MAG: NADH-quinone oxidoreductase subunit NuoF [Synergistetes bacterium HGW-Synergistetes-1]MBP9558958.1 NADH-quinone oxidoreductase subunit NuoF [Synergistaceae bacterium]MDD4750895.1 NADH-quinone oxidoreductase subunit NuoF [Synergistaceae bacterium]MDD4838143.1 NADH-quinone oxidoreductase subunit NuoF [Synergistaceae bacterium]
MALVRAHILICTGTGCTASGAKDVLAKFEVELKAKKLRDEVSLVETGCHGFCEGGPLVIIYPEGTFYTRVKPEDVAEIVEEHILKGRIVSRLLFKEPLTAEQVPNYDEIAFYKKQHRLVLRNCGHINPDSIEEYIGADGYEGLAKALLEMTPGQVVEEMKKTGLRGRGGGGFPTGMKWMFCAKSPGPKKYVICNADEGDPGAFMDRSLLEGDPHAILEGMAICAYAIGADEGYIYCRAEYPLAIKRLKQAIAQAEEAGLLGEKILGTDFNFTIHIKEGAGAFVCGEETALMASIEGKRGMPRPRPPFPAVKGLWEKPSNINNVETFANVPYIFRVGAEEYAKLGTEKSKGTKVFALTGKINNTGLAEVPMGITMREIIFDIGGGIMGGKKFKAVQIGGPSGGCIPEELLDTPVDYDSLIAAGAMMGSGGLVVMDEDTCMVDVAKFFLNFTQSESCGKCTPCREGTKRMLEMLTAITDGKGKEGDIEKLERLAKSIKAGALCALGQTAPNPILSTLRYFRDEYEAHIYEKRCPAGVCTALIGYKITDKCVGCGLCKKVCPVDAISGEPKGKHTIDPEKCIKCGACMEKCPFKAIIRG